MSSNQAAGAKMLRPDSDFFQRANKILSAVTVALDLRPRRRADCPLQYRQSNGRIGFRHDCEKPRATIGSDEFLEVNGPSPGTQYIFDGRLSGRNAI